MADVTGDGFVDLVVTVLEGASVAVAAGDGAGNFAPTVFHPYDPSGFFSATFITIADVTGDGDPDLLVTRFDAGEVVVLVGDGQGNFFESGSSPFAVGPSARTTVVDDFDGDGRPDIATSTQDGVAVLRQEEAF